MAFWKKKGDDPWDRAPERRQETAWWVQDAPAGEQTAPSEAEESLGESIRKFWLGGEEEPIPPEKCPWCGKDMEWGRMTGGRDGVKWQNWQPKGALGLGRPEAWKRWNMLDEHKGLTAFKTVWHCESCGKMVLDAPKEDASSVVDLGAYSGGGGFAADPKTYEAYQEQWGESE